MKMRITVLRGDGIGPEIMEQALKSLRTVCTIGGIDLTLDEQLLGGAAIDQTGEPLPKKTVESCRQSDAVLLGAVGGPRWDRLPAQLRPEKGLLEIRSELGLFANLRPARIFPELRDSSPLKPGLVEKGVDLLVVRELTGGIYFGRRGSETVDGTLSSFDEMRYSEYEVARIARVAFDCASRRRKRVTCVDKANVLASSRLFRQTVAQVATNEYPDIDLQNMYVDNAAMQLVCNPSQFDVIVTGNLFGDILSDESAMLTGSIGMLPSASLGGSGFGLYEPVHGSAPDIAGRGIANPLATILSVALMMKHTFGLNDYAAAIEQAAERSLKQLRTPDLLPLGAQGHGLTGYLSEALGAKKVIQSATTGEVGDFVAEELHTILTQ